MAYTYKDLKVWQISQQTAVEIILEFKKCKDFGFRDQITRSALSVPANIAEGFGRNSSKEFLLFLGYSQGSCCETGSHLSIGEQVGYISKDNFDQINTRIFEVTKMISSLAAAERKNPKKKIPASVNL